MVLVTNEIDQYIVTLYIVMSNTVRVDCPQALQDLTIDGNIKTKILLEDLNAVTLLSPPLSKT